MKILGHGIDIADVAKIRRLLQRFGEDAISRQFTARERDAAPGGPKRAEYFAACFAAKEAVLKALGTGFARGVAFTDIEIVNSREVPTVLLSGRARSVAERLGVHSWRLSIGQAAGVALASAIAVSR